jgi:hypothetical protein
MKTRTFLVCELVGSAVNRAPTLVQWYCSGGSRQNNDEVPTRWTGVGARDRVITKFGDHSRAIPCARARSISKCSSKLAVPIATKHPADGGKQVN